MAHIEVDKVHNLGIAEAMTRIALAEEQLVSKYSFIFIWNGHRAEIKGLGASGKVMVDDVRLRLDINLTLMLRPLAGKIKRFVEATIDDALAGKMAEL